MCLITKIYELFQASNLKPNREHIVGHLIYDTYVAIYNGDELVGAATFNIKDDTFYVTNVAISKDCRWLHGVESMIEQGMRKFPYCKWVSGERPGKVSPFKVYELNKIYRVSKYKNIN